MRDDQFQGAVLDWYDANARDLPWRVGPERIAGGVRPDPYRVWLSEIMLQQTTVAAVRSYFAAFTSRWPDVSALAAAVDAEVMAAWAGLGYYARARNLLKCARVVARDFDGVFPTAEPDLLRLPGIGPYSAAAISAIAFGRPANVVDGNIERIISRFCAIRTPLPGAKTEIKTAAAQLARTNRPGDYAQALMDIGATICTAKSPACGLCPIRTSCAARRLGIAADLPKRDAKPAKPTRTGTLYIARRLDGAWLLETRPEKGLLGGMLGWPGGAWTERPSDCTPPMVADWAVVDGEVRHTFTHFHLRLTVFVAEIDDDAVPTLGKFLSPSDFRPHDLPTVMRKAYDLAWDHLGASAVPAYNPDHEHI